MQNFLHNNIWITFCGETLPFFLFPIDLFLYHNFEGKEPKTISRCKFMYKSIFTSLYLFFGVWKFLRNNCCNMKTVKFPHDTKADYLVNGFALTVYMHCTFHKVFMIMGHFFLPFVAPRVKCKLVETKFMHRVNTEQEKTYFNLSWNNIISKIGRLKL